MFARLAVVVKEHSQKQLQRVADDLLSRLGQQELTEDPKKNHLDTLIAKLRITKSYGAI